MLPQSQCGISDELNASSKSSNQALQQRQIGYCIIGSLAEHEIMKRTIGYFGAAIGLALMATSAQAEQNIRVATWNIANLWHVAGVSLHLGRVCLKVCGPDNLKFPPNH
jgi:hypothetical protein